MCGGRKGRSTVRPPTDLPTITQHHHPTKTTTVDRLIYAPHIYGPSVYEHGYMKEPDFPNNLPAVRSAFLRFGCGLWAWDGVGWGPCVSQLSSLILVWLTKPSH